MIYICFTACPCTFFRCKITLIYIKAGVYELGSHPFLQLENIPAISTGEEKRKERQMRDDVVCS